MSHLVSSLTKHWWPQWNIQSLPETKHFFKTQTTVQNTELNTSQKGGQRDGGREIKIPAFVSRDHINIFIQYADMYSSKLSSKHWLNIEWVRLFYIQHIDRPLETSEILNSSKEIRLLIFGYETQCYWFPNMATTDIWYLHFAVTEQNMTIMCYTYKVPFIHGAPILPILVHWFSQKTWKAEGKFVLPPTSQMGILKCNRQ